MQLKAYSINLRGSYSGIWVLLIILYLDYVGCPRITGMLSIVGSVDPLIWYYLDTLVYLGLVGAPNFGQPGIIRHRMS